MAAARFVFERHAQIVLRAWRNTNGALWGGEKDPLRDRQRVHSTTCARFFGGSTLRSGSRAATNIFTREGVDEILNLQPKGSMAKPYQVKQVRRVLVQYKLAGEGQ